MSALSRGTRNAYRNLLRTISVTAILGLSLGMIVVMLAARGAVDNRIAEVKRTIGNTVTISPAGARGFIGGGEPLTNAQVTTTAATAHVTSVDATIDAQLTTNDTTLKSAIEAGTLGGRGFRVFRGGSTGSGTSTSNDPPADFAPPIFAIGTNNANYGGTMVGSNLTISSGTVPDMTGDADVAVLGKNLAEKNSLAVGSTFTAYTKTITVAAIYDAGNEFANNAAVFPLRTLQRLSSQTDQVTTIVAHVDTTDSLASVTSALSSAFGTTADVTSSADTIQSAIQPLENIRTIAATSLIGAFVAAAVITLLTMVMIVRERRKEIAVLKAIGASDPTIITQFTAEAVVLSLMGSVVGTALGLVLSNPILKALVTSNQTDPFTEGPTGPGGGAVRIAVGGFRAVQGSIRDLQAVVDWHLILYGVLAAVLIAIVGSALPSWLIGRIRPAEVLRSE
ncbi:MAG: ABC transporter permease [Candidatus Kerfeldbacteria bacterium]|nr:ABC transporter permease [Candidatus Kerfeldbacteria bacterium]